MKVITKHYLDNKFLSHSIYPILDPKDKNDGVNEGASAEDDKEDYYDHERDNIDSRMHRAMCGFNKG